MKDFGRWMAGQVPPAKPTVDDIVEEFECLDKRADGTYWARCCACENDYEIYCAPEDFDGNFSYCGGSPGCCP